MARRSPRLVQSLGSRQRNIYFGSNEAGGPEGSATAAHTHPGSEAFYVLKGELSQKTPHGVARVAAGQNMVGHGGGTPMVVSNSGSGDLRELALFVVDATKPFSSPAQLP